VIETIVIRTVRLGVVGGREDRHLVPVDGVVTEEELHLVGNLFGCASVLPGTILNYEVYLMIFLKRISIFFH